MPGSDLLRQQQDGHASTARQLVMGVGSWVGGSRQSVWGQLLSWGTSCSRFRPLLGIRSSHQTDLQRRPQSQQQVRLSVWHSGSHAGPPAQGFRETEREVRQTRGGAGRKALDLQSHTCCTAPGVTNALSEPVPPCPTSQESSKSKQYK